MGEAIHIADDLLARVQRLYEDGQCVRAYHAALEAGPLHLWSGTKAGILAGRLAQNVGAYRLGRVLRWRAWRSDKCNPDLAAYHGHAIMERRGPLAAFEFLESFRETSFSSQGSGLIHFYCVRASVAGHLRDFSTAESWLRRAGSSGADDPWFAATRAHVMEMQDRYPEALEAAREALRERPWYRPGVQAVAHALQLLDRHEEALALLSEAAERLENMHLVRQLALLQKEKQQYENASASLQRVVELAPLIEKGERDWVLAEQVTLACAREDFAGALVAAKQLDDAYHRNLAARLESPGEHRRVRLNVPFVRQHHVTCGPATLAAISKYWNQPAEHLEIAEAICYDGTAAESERQWAESNGWVAREFKLTWDAARSLLDRGIPFTLTTSGATSGHLQAVVGYDELRQTLSIRDPFVYLTVDSSIADLLESFASTGPRGMALVPTDKCELLDSLPLPEADLYDELHQVQRALAQHHRGEAVVCRERMRAAFPQHRLTLNADRALAAYDGNTPSLLESLEALLRLFPEDGNLLLCKLGCLRELARRDERLQLLEKLSAKSGIDPIFWLLYAQELRPDARQHDVALSWVRWALRYRQSDPALISALADLLWDKREFARATRYYRLAACAGEKTEDFSRRFFLASLHMREREAALQFLQERNARFGKGSANPTITLVESLQHMQRTEQAFRTLEDALAARPKDGHLRLFAADFNARFSRYKQAAELLEEAHDRSSPVTWHRAAAALASSQNRKTAALEHWQEVLRFEPLAHDALRAVSLLLAETQNRTSALAFLDQTCERFPYSCPLLALRIEWLGEGTADEVILRVREMIEVNPADAWAWRELALKLAQKGLTSQALEAAEESIRLEPHHSEGYTVRARISLKAGNFAEARRDLHEALRLQVDNVFAVTNFVSTAPTLSERKEALGVVAEELRRQVIFDNALLAYQTAARGVLPPGDVLALLREAHQFRRDLWQSWSVLINQLVDMAEYSEAMRFAKTAADRFPLVPCLWVDLARVQQALVDEPGEIAALEKALEISPGFAFAARQLAGIHERQNRLAEARAVMETAIAANPLDVENRCCLSHILWSAGEREQAISAARHAVHLNPGFDWPWSALRDYGVATGRPELAAEMARELTQSRGGEARSWLLLAKCLSPSTEAEELFRALDRALALNPRCEEAYDIRARVLSGLDRFEEALAHCEPAGLKPVPASLRLRAAWIEAQRGNLSGAITRAVATLAEYPDYYFGWQSLSDWYVDSNQLERAIEAAENMARLAPLDPVPLGYLGELKRRLGNHEGGRASFQRAFALDPNYHYAGFRLFSDYVERSEFEEARKTLGVLERRGQTCETLACSIELAIATGDGRGAVGLFRQLCGMPDPQLRSLWLAATALESAGLAHDIDGILSGFVRQEKCPSAIAELYVLRQTNHSRWNLHKRLEVLKGETGRRAVMVYLDQLGDAFNRARERGDISAGLRLRYHFRKLLRAQRPWLHADVQAWGKVGYVLTCIGRPGPAIAWLSDWKDRPQAESWMLYNLVTMLQKQGKYPDCLEILRHATGLRHNEHLYEHFRLWTAFEEALAGDYEAARHHLERLARQPPTTTLGPLRAMTEILLTLGAETGTALPCVKAQLRTAFGSAYPSDKTREIRKSYCRFLKAASSEVRGLRLWGWYFYRGPSWLFVPIFMCLVPVIITAPVLVVPAIILLIVYANRK